MYLNICIKARYCSLIRCSPIPSSKLSSFNGKFNLKIYCSPLYLRDVWHYKEGNTGLRADTHMTSTLRGGGGLRWKWDVTGRKEWGVKECSGRQILTFLLKKIEFAPWPDIKLSQRLIYYWQEIFLFDSDVRQRSHTLMIPLHYLWAKSNNRTCGCDVTLFLFRFRSCTCKERLH